YRERRAAKDRWIRLWGVRRWLRGICPEASERGRDCSEESDRWARVAVRIEIPRPRRRNLFSEDRPCRDYPDNPDRPGADVTPRERRQLSRHHRPSARARVPSCFGHRDWMDQDE